MSDASEAHKQLLREHARLQEQNALLRRVLHLCGAPDDFELVLEGMMDAVMAYYHAHSGALYMFDDDSGGLYFAAARGPKAQEVLALDLIIPPGQGIAGSCFQENEVIAVSDAHRDARFAKEVSEAVGYEVRSMLTAPIAYEGVPLGVWQVINKQDSSSFSPDEVATAKQLGRTLGGILSLGLELEDLRQRNAELEAQAAAAGGAA